MFLSLLGSLAWGFDPGMGVGARGVRSSDGLHRLQPTGAVWLKEDVGDEGWFVKGELIVGGRADPVLEGTMHQLVLGPGLLVGREGGVPSTRVFGAVGAAGFLMVGGLDFDQWVVRPGLRAEWGLDWEVRPRLVIGGVFGGTYRGNGGDVDLLFSLGWKR